MTSYHMKRFTVQKGLESLKGDVLTLSQFIMLIRGRTSLNGCTAAVKTRLDKIKREPQLTAL